MTDSDTHKKIPLIFKVSPWFFQALIWIPAYFIFRIFGSIKIKGKNNLRGIDTSNGVIFAANHASELDPTLLPSSLSPFSRLMPMHFAALDQSHYSKRPWWINWYFNNTIFKLWGAHPVFPGLQDYDKSLPNIVALLKDRRSVMYFPEGSMSRTEDMKPFKGGIAYLATVTNAVIVPVALKGLYKISPKSFLMRKHKLTVKFGKPIRIDSLKERAEKNIHDDVGTIYKKEAAILREDIEKMLEE